VEVYGPRHSKVATIGVIASLVMIFLGSMFIPRRACIPLFDGAPHMVLDWGVCKPCSNGCKRCSSVDVCEGCYAGNYLSPETNQCMDCDEDPDKMLCYECEAPVTPGKAPRCLTCGPGLLMDPRT
jgi:hypothetical protein